MFLKSIPPINPPFAPTFHTHIFETTFHPCDTTAFQQVDGTFLSASLTLHAPFEFESSRRFFAFRRLRFALPNTRIQDTEGSDVSLDIVVKENPRREDSSRHREAVGVGKQQKCGERPKVEWKNPAPQQTTLLPLGLER